MCKQLGISRTPLREALFRLEQEGLVKSDPSRGFSVVPLSAREVREIYPIIWTLEALAVKLSRNNFDTIGLKDLNRLLSETTNATERQKIDTSLHEKLTAGCPNRRLLQQIRIYKQTAYRYENAYMLHSNKLDMSVQQHSQIIEAVEGNELSKALDFVEAHWQAGMQELLDWLDWRES